MSGMKNVKMEDFGFLQKNKKLTHFKFNSMSFDDDLIGVISRNINFQLRELLLNWSLFSNTIQGVSCLSKFVHLTNLSLKQSRKLADDQIITQLAEALPTLETLDMEYWQLSSRQIQQFSAFKHLRLLTMGHFIGCEALNEEIEKLKEENPKLVVKQYTVLY